MTKRFPVNPAHPERICWGCDRYCPVDAMACGNGSVATLHPSELFGEDWERWGTDLAPPANPGLTPMTSQAPVEVDIQSLE